MTIIEAQRILGLNPGCKPVDVRRTYRRLIRTLHPDLYPQPADKERATEQIRVVIEAYELLEAAGFPPMAPSSGPPSSTGPRRPPPEPDLRPGDIGARYRARWGPQAPEDETLPEGRAARAWRPMRTLWEVVLYTEAPLWQRVIGGVLALLIYAVATLLALTYLEALFFGRPPTRGPQ